MTKPLMGPYWHNKKTYLIISYTMLHIYIELPRRPKNDLRSSSSIELGKCVFPNTVSNMRFQHELETVLETVVGNAKTQKCVSLFSDGTQIMSLGHRGGGSSPPLLLGRQWGMNLPPLAVARAAAAQGGQPPDHERQLLRRWGGSTSQRCTFSCVLLENWGVPGSNILATRFNWNGYGNVHIIYHGCICG